jgi:hypothetical protein
MARKYRLTDGTVVAGGQPAMIEMAGNAGSEYINAPVPAIDSTSAGLGVTLSAGPTSPNGWPTALVTVPVSVAPQTVIQFSFTDVTAAGTLTSNTLPLTAISAPPPPLPEPTSLIATQLQ